MKVLLPLPSMDFDPTETGVPWKLLSAAGVEITVATPSGTPAQCDSRMLTGRGLGPFAPLLMADRNGREAFREFEASQEFKGPIPWDSIEPSRYDGLILPGGHAPGMREYLESAVLERATAEFFRLGKPVGAICHGVVLASRSLASNDESVLKGRKTTALLASQELTAWALTCAWLGNYYRTYPQTVEAEVRSRLAKPQDFIRGPLPLLRDSPSHPDRGFAVRDGNYVSARWPGDAHRFAREFLELLGKKNG